eukprot:scaffold88155_cov56-Phaeocystis_antarctica.AAC.1
MRCCPLGTPRKGEGRSEGRFRDEDTAPRAQDHNPRGGTGPMATDNREDKFGSSQRGEETSRLETRLDAEPEGGQGEFGSS